MRWLVAGIFPVLACAIQWACWPLIRPLTWFFFYPAVYFSSWVGGMWAGLAATLIATVLGWYFFSAGSENVVSTALFAGAGALFSLTHGWLASRNQSLQWAAEDLSELLEQASDAVFLADMEDRYTEVNAAGCRLLGYAREELVGKKIKDLIPPDDAPRLAEDKARFLRGEAGVSEWSLRRKDGSWLPVEVSARILPDGRWLALVRDISERKQTEEQLRQARSRLELAIMGADLATWDWNIKAGEVIFNPRWAEMRGYRLDEIKPGVESWISNMHPEDWPRVKKALDEYFQGRSPEYECEFRARTKSGDWIWILDRGRVFSRDETGEPVRMVGMELEITERKRAEEERRRLGERERFRIALEASASGIVVVGRDGRIAFVNAEAERLFGWACEEMPGKPVEVLLPERFRAGHPEYRDGFFRDASGKRQMGVGRDLYALRKDGSEMPVEIGLTRFEEGGQVYVVASVTDISQRKAAEARLRRTVLDLEGFAYTISHDLRSPIRAVQGYSHYLAERLADRVDPESRGMLERIGQAAVRLDHLIRDLLSFASIGREEVELEAVDLDGIVAHVAEEYPELAKARVRARPPLGQVLAQSSLMIQVLSHLLGNAVKFIPKDRTPEIDVWTDRCGEGKLQISVQDNGIGIPREAWGRVFQPFVRLQSSSEFEGTGIGLAIVKRAVERMGGRVGVESEPGKGSRFWVELEEA